MDNEATDINQSLSRSIVHFLLEGGSTAIKTGIYLVQSVERVYEGTGSREQGTGIVATASIIPMFLLENAAAAISNS